MAAARLLGKKLQLKFDAGSLLEVVWQDVKPRSVPGLPGRADVAEAMARNARRARLARRRSIDFKFFEGIYSAFTFLILQSLGQ